MILIVVDRCVECGDEVSRKKLVNGLCPDCCHEKAVEELYYGN